LKLLLTGAQGFTGRHLQAMAAARGHEVHALTCDLLDTDALCREVTACAPHAVIHLAAIAFVGHGSASDFYRVNTVGSTQLLDALARLADAPPQVLLASSANIYGNARSSPITEDAPAAPVNHYAMSKLAMETMASNWAGRLPITIARPFNYTGPGQDESFVIAKLVAHFARRAPTISLGNIDVEREYNDVGMVCRAYLDVIEQGISGTFNVCTGTTHALRDVIDLLGQITGHTPQIQVDPALVRAHEIRRLCGSPARLQAALSEHGLGLSPSELKPLLERMLADKV
jgi:nucleoside-diphosphate-sugar epimerase